MEQVKVWEQHELEFLRDNHKNMSQKEIAKLLGCNKSQVSHKCKILGLSKIKKWTDTEVEFMETNIDKGFEFIANELNRTFKSVESKYQKSKKSYYIPYKSENKMTTSDIIIAIQGGKNMNELQNLLPHLHEIQIRQICNDRDIEILPRFLKIIKGVEHKLCKICDIFKENTRANFYGGSEGLVCIECLNNREFKRKWENSYGIVFDKNKDFFDYDIIEWYNFKLEKRFRAFPKHIVTKENNYILLRHLAFDLLKIKTKEELLKLDVSILFECTILKSICNNYKLKYKEILIDVFHEFNIHPDELDLPLTISGLACNSYEERDLYDYIYTNYNTNITPIGLSRENSFYNDVDNEIYYPDFNISEINGCNLEKPLIVEYYGLYADNSKSNNYITDYTNKAKRKNKFYNSLSSFFFLDIYPCDLKDNFKGVKLKIDKFIREVNL